MAFRSFARMLQNLGCIILLADNVFFGPRRLAGPCRPADSLESMLWAGHVRSHLGYDDELQKQKNNFEVMLEVEREFVDAARRIHLYDGGDGLARANTGVSE